MSDLAIVRIGQNEVQLPEWGPGHLERLNFMKGDPGDRLTHLLYNAYRIKLPDAKGKAGTEVVCYPGVTSDGQVGPQRRPFMIIGKQLTSDEEECHEAWSGHLGDLIRFMLKMNKISPSEVYLTHLCKFRNPYPGGGAMPSAWLKSGLPQLMLEISLVDPQFILCLGADPVKALFGGGARLGDLRGAVKEWNGKIVGGAHSAADALFNTAMYPDFISDCRAFFSIVAGDRVAEQKKYVYLKSAAEVKAALEECAQETRFALDCEWEGESPADGRLMSIQFSPKRQVAYVICLYLPMDNWVVDSEALCIRYFYEAMTKPHVRVGGHNLRADMEWLTANGCNLWDVFVARGFDTMLASHLLCETAEHNLTSCHVRDTDLPRYDAKVDEYLKNGIVHSRMPSSVLLPYAAADVDATIRLWDVYELRLWRDHLIRCEEMGVKDVYAAIMEPRAAQAKGVEWVNSLWNLYRFIELPVGRVIAEMETVGLAVDRQRLLDMVKVFSDKRDEYIDKLKILTGNPNFNPGSAQQVRDWLFGDPNRVDDDGRVIGCLGLMPIMATGKRGAAWEELIEKKDVWYEEGWGWRSNQYNPKADSTTLKQLADQGSMEAAVLRDYKFVDQICKSFLHEEEEDPYTGFEDFKRGLLGLMKKDGRLHTRFSQLTDTGRWRSSRPNCQNFPKNREADLARIFYGKESAAHSKAKKSFNAVLAEKEKLEKEGKEIPSELALRLEAEEKVFAEAEDTLHAAEEKFPSLRSAIIPDPGCILMERDLDAGETWTLGYIAKDKKMIADLNLKDKKGTFISFHSSAAVRLFKLDMTASELDERRKAHDTEGRRLNQLRGSTKTVNFGIPYGRGAAALSRAITAEGIPFSLDEAKELLGGWHGTYDRASEFLDECKETVCGRGLLRMPFGRLRHFFKSNYKSVNAGMEREACNAPIQGTVADAINYALVLLDQRRRDLGLKFKLVLAIHDAILAQVPYEEITAASDLMSWAMSQAFRVPGTDLYYHTALDVYDRWGEGIEWDEALELQREATSQTEELAV